MKVNFTQIGIAAALLVTALPAFAGNLTWSGDVDDTVIVYVHHDNVRERTTNGQTPRNIDVELSGRLPEAPVPVVLTNWNGRGLVQLIRQPDARNHFTAAVLIRDPQQGAGHYTFTIHWDRDAFQGAPGY